VLRTTDLVFRYSDEELVILMPETGPDATRRVAHRIVAALVDGTPPAGELPIQIGLAFAPADGRSIEELLAKARGRLERQRWADALDADQACAEGARS
jgi:GGDEF domain-containing protein